MEVWLPVVGYEGCYEVSNYGRVRSVYRSINTVQRVRSGNVREVRRLIPGKELKPGIASNGYPTVSLSGKTRTVHSLVMEAFKGPCPEGHCVCHNDGDRKNSRLGNLRYDTYRGNNLDMDLHGTRMRGSQYANAKLDETKAAVIRALKGLVPQSKLAEMFGVSAAAIQAVHDGRTWTHA